MSHTPENPQAFPLVVGSPEDAHGELHHGMTLRDYFAAKAMQGMISKSSGQDSTGGSKGVPLIAEYAYEYADAMIKARAL